MTRPRGRPRRAPADRSSSFGRTKLSTIIRRQLNRQLETKHKSFEADWTDVGAVSGTLTELTNISQGVGDDQRVGNKINLQKIYIQKVFRLDPSGTTQISAHGAVRVILAQSRGGPLTNSDFPNYYAPCDLDKMIVLKDKLMNLSGGGAVSGASYAGPTYSQFKFNVRGINLPKSHLQYNDTGTTPANNPVYLYMFSENGNEQQAGFETIYYKDG